MVLGKLCCDLTILPHWKSWLIFGESSPFMAARLKVVAARFRLVTYYNLPRSMDGYFLYIVIAFDPSQLDVVSTHA